MFLPASKVTEVAQEMVQLLTQDGDVETESPKEVQLDLEAVLHQYLRTEQELVQKAKDSLTQQGRPPADFGKVLKSLADQRKFRVGEDALDYVLEQLVEMLMNSQNVDEVFAADHDLRRKLRIPLRKHQGTDQDLDKAVRSQMKHVQEGSTLWEIEYRRVMEEIKRRKGL